MCLSAGVPACVCVCVGGRAHVGYIAGRLINPFARQLIWKPTLKPQPNWGHKFVLPPKWKRKESNLSEAHLGLFLQHFERIG